MGSMKLNCLFSSAWNLESGLEYMPWFDDQHHAEQTLDQIQNARYTVQHFKATGERAVHDVGRQRLCLEVGYGRLEAALQYQGNEQHDRHDPEQRLTQHCATKQANAINQ